MACERGMIEGFHAIVCSRGRRRAPRCKCGRAATLLCDWKVEGGTCDRPICPSCAEQVAPGKHLCPAHQAAWQEWQLKRGV